MDGCWSGELEDFRLFAAILIKVGWFVAVLLDYFCYCCRVLALIFLILATLIKVDIDIYSQIGGDWLLSSPSMATEEVFDKDRSELTN